MSRRGLAPARVVVALLCAAIVGLLVPSGASASTLPAGFEESTVLPGLGKPQDIAIAPNGRVFVAEKTGFIRVYDNVDDTTPTLVADLRVQVHNYGSRGLLSIVADPGFPAKPYVYVYYTLDAPIGGTPPVYGGGSFDACPKYNDTGDADGQVPGVQPIGDIDNCKVGGRIAKINASTGAETVLVEDYCQQFASHGGGGLVFGSDGKLYASSSDGSTSLFWDCGQAGSPKNPCGDPGGSNPSPPTSEGGRLRAQDVRTTGDPTGLTGSLIRIDNPSAITSKLDPSGNAGRIVAFGMRDATRLAVRPGTTDIWVAERGGGYFEEFHRVSGSSNKVNFGWPCYESNQIRKQSDLQDLNLCESLYSGGGQTLRTGRTTTSSRSTRRRTATRTATAVRPAARSRASSSTRRRARSRRCTGTPCSSPTGCAAASGHSCPTPAASRRRAASYRSPAWRCGPPTWRSLRPATCSTSTSASTRCSASVTRWRTRRPRRSPRRARLPASAPLAVTFSGLGSTDPDAGDALTYAWDLDGDNLLDDSTAAQPTFTYSTHGSYTVTLQVTDAHGASSLATVVITVLDSGLRTLRLSPVADARVELANPSKNYGTDAKLRTVGSTKAFESLLRFDVQGLEGTVQSARLVLTSLDATADGPAVYSTAGGWTESAVKWSNKPSFSAAGVSDKGAITAGSLVEFDVKSLINGNGELNLGLRQTSSDSVDFASREDTTAAKRPVLEVTYKVPTPDPGPGTPPPAPKVIKPTPLMPLPTLGSPVTGAKGPTLVLSAVRRSTCAAASRSRCTGAACPPAP